jgi:hypothetical protein
MLFSKYPVGGTIDSKRDEERRRSVVRGFDYDKVCYRTDQREEEVVLLNTETGEIGYSVGCTSAGETVQVKLAGGGMDSWIKEQCIEVNEER